MLRLENPDNVCYANAGTNALLSSPFVTRFLSSLPNNNVQLNTAGQKSTKPNNKPHRTSGYCGTEYKQGLQSRQ